MFKKKNKKSKIFSDQFLMIVLAVVFVTFIGLWIYQKITPEVVLVESDNDLLANELLASNSWQSIDLELTEVPPLRTNDYLSGSIDAPVELIIYNDFSDHLAARFWPIIKDLKEQFTDDLVVAWRQHPLPGRSEANQIALEIECAGQQGQFFEYTEVVVAKTIEKQPWLEWTDWANQLNLNQVQFEQCLTNPETQTIIDELAMEAEALGAIGVPSSFLNKILISGVYPLEDFINEEDSSEFGLVSLVQQIIEWKDRIVVECARLESE